MYENSIDEAKALIFRDFELENVEEKMTEAELFDLLSNHVAYMIEYRLDNLLGLMYRLDIDEYKINKALNPLNPEPANIALAHLILQRQKQRVFTKKHIKVDKIDNWADDW